MAGRYENRRSGSRAVLGDFSALFELSGLKERTTDFTDKIVPEMELAQFKKSVSSAISVVCRIRLMSYDLLRLEGYPLPRVISTSSPSIRSFSPL